MSAEPTVSAQVFVIVTNLYAGNFEREMTAYMTGQLGDCGVGGEEAEIARAELDPDVLEWLDDCHLQVADDHGNDRPCSIWPPVPDAYPESGVYSAVAVFLNEVPTPDVVAVLKARALRFAEMYRLGTATHSQRVFSTGQFAHFTGEPMSILGFELIDWHVEITRTRVVL